MALSGAWWLLAVGAAAIIAAWYYTGGKYPYGYHGLGELFVLIFFGYVATVGTVYTQSLTMPDLAWIAGSGIGMIACALLMINNIRDIPTDKIANKRTLAVRLGEKRARIAYLLLLLIPILFLTIGFAGHYPIMMCALILVPWATEIAKPVMRGATGAALIPALKQTGLYEIGYAVLITGGIIIGEITGIGALIGIAIALMVLIFWLAFEFTSRSKIMRTRRSKSTRVQSSNARTKVSYSSSAKQRGKNSRAPRSSTRGSRSKAQRRRK
ncbi:1,4-dihydroxy-2-naphthoate octaprenyltransferase [Arcanobacterium hippocoleae]|uniref:1,4-dihydroxy-2-naphthoate octaprenyltransferase n=1 Tax=Arcanobacterium hippocoleae TaxID=149017 RepID=UPI00333E9F25